MTIGDANISNLTINDANSTNLTMGNSTFGNLAIGNLIGNSTDENSTEPFSPTELCSIFPGHISKYEIQGVPLI